MGEARQRLRHTGLVRLFINFTFRFECDIFYRVIAEERPARVNYDAYNCLGIVVPIFILILFTETSKLGRRSGRHVVNYCTQLGYSLPTTE